MSADSVDERRETLLERVTSSSWAFVVVVCAACLSASGAMAYSGRAVSLAEALSLASAAVAYLIMGTSGFDRCRRSSHVGASVGYFIIQLTLAGAMILGRGSSGELSLILLPLAGKGALILPRRVMVPVCALIYLTLVMPLIVRSRWLDAVAVAVVYGTGIIFVVVFTRMAASEREARVRLEAANERLREDARRVEDLAVANERNRIAGEVHDTVGHYLTVVNVQIGAARAVLEEDRGRASDHLARAQALTQEGLSDIRRSVASLRAAPESLLPLEDALARLIEGWAGSGMTTRLAIGGVSRPLSPQSSLTLYRAAQEGITNAARHGRARSVALSLEYRGDDVSLRIADDGRGAECVTEGFGLMGLRERVAQLRGKMTLETARAAGFALSVEVPG